MGSLGVIDASQLTSGDRCLSDVFGQLNFFSLISGVLIFFSDELKMASYVFQQLMQHT